MTRFYLVLLGCLVGSSLSVVHAAENGGLESPVARGGSARTLALGGALMAHGVGTDSLWINPAGISGTDRGSFFFLREYLFADTTQDHAAVAWPTLDFGSFAIGFTRWQIKDIDGRDDRNQKTQIFSAVSEEWLVAWGKKWSPKLSTGLSLKFDTEKISDFSGSGMGMDAGLAGSLSLFDWGVSLRNLIPVGVQLISEKDLRPMIFGAGIEVPILLPRGLEVLVLGQVQGSRKQGFGLRAGVEIQNRFAALRAGLDGTGLSAGLGIQRDPLRLDYAALFHPHLDISHKVSLQIGFGSRVDIRRHNRAQQAEGVLAEHLAEVKQARGDEYLNQSLRLEGEGDLIGAISSMEKAVLWSGSGSKYSGRLDGLIDQRVVLVLRQAQARLDKKDAIMAQVLAREVQALRPNNPEAGKLLSRAEKMAKEMSEASLFRRTLSDEQMQGHIDSGMKHFKSREYEAARDEWRKVVEADPIQKNLYEYLERAEERIAEAREEAGLPSQEQIKRRRIQAEAQRAVRLYLDGKLPAAIEVYRGILKLDPDNVDAKKNLDRAVEDLVKMKSKGVRW